MYTGSIEKKIQCFILSNLSITTKSNKHLFFVGDSNTLNNTSVIDNCDWTLAAEVAWNVQHDLSCNYSLLKETINAYK